MARDWCLARQPRRWEALGNELARHPVVHFYSCLIMKRHLHLHQLMPASGWLLMPAHRDTAITNMILVALQAPPNKTTRWMLSGEEFVSRAPTHRHLKTLHSAPSHPYYGAQDVCMPSRSPEDLLESELLIHPELLEPQRPWSQKVPKHGASVFRQGISASIVGENQQGYMAPNQGGGIK